MAMVCQRATFLSAAAHSIFNPSRRGAWRCSSTGSAGRWPELRDGTGLPLSRYTKLLAHWYDIAVEQATITTNGTHIQNPIVLCQLKSRARPLNPRRKVAAILTVLHVHFLGQQR